MAMLRQAILFRSAPRRARLACVAAVLVTLGIAAPTASAEHITLGIADPHTTIDTVECLTVPCTYAELSSSAGLFAAPADGRITSWWAAESLSGKAELRVLRRVPPLKQGTYKAVGTSSQETVDHTVAHHDTDLPINANDVIGLTLLGSTSGVDHLFDKDSAVDTFAGLFPDGTAELPTQQSTNTGTLEFGALFFYRPVVTSIAASSGSTAGGETVTIEGDHLTEATSIRFGSAAAKSFSVDSNGQITATAPPEPAGTVDVTVVGPGGTSATSSIDRYTFVAPTASLSPETLDFGDEPVGKTSGVHSVTLTNTGKVPVVVGIVSLGGADVVSFTKLSDGCEQRAVAPGKSCTVKLVFTPNAAGARHATLRLGDNASDGPHTVVISGNGTVATTTTTTTAPTTTGSTTTTAPSNALAIGRLHGALLVVTVGSAGVVRIADASRKHHLLRPSSARGGPGSLVVGLHLTSAAAKTLARRHRLVVGARITFTPRGGTPVTRIRTFALRTTRR